MTQRTPNQNAALHVFFDQLAQSLNDAGMPMQKVLKPSIDIDWNPVNVKQYLWRPIQIAITQKKSTTELSKSQEIEKIHDILMRHLGEKFGLEYIPFPSMERRSDLIAGMEIDIRNDPSYPDQEDLEIKF